MHPQMSMNFGKIDLAPKSTVESFARGIVLGRNKLLREIVVAREPILGLCLGVILKPTVQCVGGGKRGAKNRAGDRAQRAEDSEQRY